MRLLVSVANAEEALAAIEGGADVIDAKDPANGALGPVEPDAMSAIVSVVAGRRLVTAAVGDAVDDVHDRARELLMRGARLVKIGFSGHHHPAGIERIIARLAAECAGIDGQCGVVAVAYADAPSETIDASRLIPVAARAGARGALIDTTDKRGPGLTSLWSAAEIAKWVREVRDWGLIAAVAGKLTRADLAVVADIGADIAGVRGAACVGGRGGRVTAERVRDLVSACGDDRVREAARERALEV